MQKSNEKKDKIFTINTNNIHNLISIKHNKIIFVNNFQFYIGRMTSWKDIIVEDTLDCDWLKTMQKVLFFYFNFINF